MEKCAPCGHQEGKGAYFTQALRASGNCEDAFVLEILEHLVH